MAVIAHPVDPPAPAPLHLQHVPLTNCKKGMECMTRSGLKTEIRNKVQIGRWMSQAGAVINYYRGVNGAGANSGNPTPVNSK